MATDIETAVAAHYGKSGLLDAIAGGLKALGADMNALKPEDLAPVDEFHTAGRLSTLRALRKIPFQPRMHVLDAGSGIGGTARCLAKEYGCRVTGIDLTPEYVEAARILTEWMELSDACKFHLGSATDMPFDDASFDAGVSFHAAMNIANRAKFYSELARVLRPGAPLCIFDVMKGPTPGMVYPVPWAETERTSFLKSSEETKALLRDASFDLVDEESFKDLAADYFRDAAVKASQEGGPPPLGLHLLAGTNAPEKFGNYVQALHAAQIEPVLVVARRR